MPRRAFAVISGILLLFSALLQIILGGLFLLSSKFEEHDAYVEAEDLSMVSKDLVNEDTLKKEHQVAKQKVGSVGVGEIVLGSSLFATALIQIVASILLFLRRAKRFILVALGICVLSLVSMMIFGPFIKTATLPLGFISLGSQAIVLLLTLLNRSPSVSDAK